MTTNEPIWESVPLISDKANEATVEVQFIASLLDAIGYKHKDIAAKHPVEFQEGRESRKKFADFVVFDGVSRESGHSLFVVEAKRPGESFDEARRQAESYAVQVRALVYVVTDGQILEIWQYRRTSVSEKVFACPVPHLAGHQAVIEALLNRHTLKQYRKEVREPRLEDIAWRLDAYRESELKRLSSTATKIDRTLSEMEVVDRGSKLYRSNQSLQWLPAVSIIYAPSGMGKTSVLEALYSQALMHQLVVADLPIPVQVSLPDLEDQTVSDFAYARIRAHLPGFTPAMYEQARRTTGVHLFCDAFDRLSSTKRETVDRELRLLLRDFPETRLTLTSRRGTAPALDLNSYYLQPLDDHQKFALEETVWNRKAPADADMAGRVLEGLPVFIDSLASSPLIFSRLVEFVIDKRVKPTNLVDIFEFWLESTLRTRQQATTFNEELRNALTVVSTASWDRAATVSEVTALLARAGLQVTLLDDLVDHGAVIKTGRNLNVEHEALADYLRAEACIAADNHPDNTTIPTERLDRQSFFPILMVALATTPEMQRNFLSQVSLLGLERYLNAVRYRSPVLPRATIASHESLEAHILNEIADGFTQPATIFFPSLLPNLVFQETGVHASSVSAHGSLARDQKSVSFALAPAGTSGPENPKHRRCYSLDQAQLDARLIGIEILYGALHRLLEAATLNGGPIWHEERLLSRLRLLLKSGHNVENSLEIAKQLAFWERQQGAIFLIDRSRAPREQTVYADEILVDLRCLNDAGLEHATVWWNRNENEPWWLRDWDGTNETLCEHFLRLDEAYSEVVNRNFGSLKEELANFVVMPRSWNLFVRSDGAGKLHSVTSFWHPIEIGMPSMAEAKKIESENDDDPGMQWHDSNADALARLGRSYISMEYSIGIPPSFSGRQLTGIFDGNTSVINGVNTWLRDEIAEYFKIVTTFQAVGVN
ncbi:Type I restriction enzyme R protein N terminus (HSDR_N) [Paraburkholderia steynii]|uniref:Type I restriction enzyme R protein N terminus (HSDR_N) n=1 Tax=Paraburkholderia steynii TaxID=1245441 RepID=A0A7Z7BJ42_9BURK|nr:type I restriction enzyme HsdR N-terminal domain-containing protein [Paraburkholderia steynii]SDJ36302.1 Type I restriction enzyme R protein N terminus (HSDR_N) [Paraburkholderia steynii]